MIFTDYYKFEKIKLKSGGRMDCTASTMSYNEFEEKRCTKSTKAKKNTDATNAGDLVIYYNNTPEHYGASNERKPDKSITLKGRNLTGVFIPDIESERCDEGFTLFMGYGDVSGTGDLLIFKFEHFEVINNRVQEGAVLEMFIARGQSMNKTAVLELVQDGELDEEMEALKQRATQESNTNTNV